MIAIRVLGFAVFLLAGFFPASADDTGTPSAAGAAPIPLSDNAGRGGIPEALWHAIAPAAPAQPAPAPQ
jgi:hypothetical protein